MMPDYPKTGLSRIRPVGVQILFWFFCIRSVTVPKVWIADKMSARAIEVFKGRGIEVDYKPGLSDDEKLAI